MALTDKLKDLKSKAEETVLERKDQIEQAVHKVGDVADQRTGGKYREKIDMVGGKALGYVDSLGESGKEPQPREPATDVPASPPAPGGAHPDGAGEKPAAGV